MGSDSSNNQESLGQTVLDDIRKTSIKRRFWQELTDLYDFYLDEEKRTELADYGRIRRAFMVLGWLLKGLLFKLSPARRLALLAALLFTVAAQTSLTLFERRISADLRPAGFIVLLVILMLELKDKLLAKDEIQVAREVQLALLPNSHPKIPCWQIWSYSRPANDVGGDLVDYLELGGFRHGVILGDVAGKGLGAALLTAKLQATLSALITDAASLDELGARLNTILVRDGIDNRFATAFYAEIEHDSDDIRYLNAGHNPAYVIREGRLETLGASAMPLGMMPGTQYREESVRICKGELLIIYSDGLTEAEDEDGQDFGNDKLEAMLPDLRGLTAEQAGRKVLRAVDRFLADQRPGDDLSLVILVRT